MAVRPVPVVVDPRYVSPRNETTDARDDQDTVSKTTIVAGALTIAALATIAYIKSDVLFGGGYGGYPGYNGYNGV